MPELPEVQTTVNGLNKCVKGLAITEVWTDFGSAFHLGKSNIKDADYFKNFRAAVRGRKILEARRRAKNVLISLSGGLTILIHLKMTGHLMYGKFRRKDKSWVPDEPGPLNDPFNRFIHLVFSLSDKKHLVLSDLRKFAKVTLLDTKKLEQSEELKNLGPEPLEKNFGLKELKAALAKRPHRPIKEVLMDQKVIAGIGNIYSDEILWLSDVQPLSLAGKIPAANLEKMIKATKSVLKKSLAVGGDSISDFRDIKGRLGGFQNKHNAYGLEGSACKKPGCDGIIKRIKFGGRSAHFCPKHQKLYK